MELVVSLPKPLPKRLELGRVADEHWEGLPDTDNHRATGKMVVLCFVAFSAQNGRVGFSRDKFVKGGSGRKPRMQDFPSKNRKLRWASRVQSFLHGRCGTGSGWTRDR